MQNVARTYEGLGFTVFIMYIDKNCHHLKQLWKYGNYFKHGGREQSFPRDVVFTLYDELENNICLQHPTFYQDDHLYGCVNGL